MSGAVTVLQDDAASKHIKMCLRDVASTRDLTEDGKKELISSIFSEVNIL
jgi:hypothetical protein